MKKEEVEWRRVKLRERDRNSQRTILTETETQRQRKSKTERERNLCRGYREKGQWRSSNRKRQTHVEKGEKKLADRQENPGSGEVGAAGERPEARPNHFFKSQHNPFSCHSWAMALLTQGFPLVCLRGKRAACGGQLISL